jgi:hypothetical protein
MSLFLLAVQRIETLEMQMDHVIENFIPSISNDFCESSLYNNDENDDYFISALFDFHKPIRPKIGDTDCYDEIDNGPLVIIKNLMKKEIADANKLIRTENTNLPKIQHKSRLKLDFNFMFAHLIPASKAFDHNASSGWMYHYDTLWKATMETAMEKEISDTNKLIDAENANLPEDQLKPLINKLNITDILPHIRSTLETDWNALDDTAQAIWNVKSDTNVNIFEGGKRRDGEVRSNIGMIYTWYSDEHELLKSFDCIDKNYCDSYNKKIKKDQEKQKTDANSESDDTKKKTGSYLMHKASQRPSLNEAIDKEIADANNFIQAENAELPEDQHKPLLKLYSTDVLSKLATARKALDDDANELSGER